MFEEESKRLKDDGVLLIESMITEHSASSLDRSSSRNDRRRRNEPRSLHGILRPLQACDMSTTDSASTLVIASHFARL
jgi:hypothetical protein